MMGSVESTASASSLGNLLAVLPALRDHHAPGDKVYQFIKTMARRDIERLFGERSLGPIDMGALGSIVFPYHNMGNVDSLNLFDLDELIIFSFYLVNRYRYRRVLDIGANIGLHSIVLSKCGYQVRSYEPDPTHFDLLKRNLAMNAGDNVEVINEAISNRKGTEEFVRVLGNTTGSHLRGSKPNPYGNLERFPVKVESIVDIIRWPDLIKLDAEGHEKEILLATTREDWARTDALVEISSRDNAEALREHFHRLGVPLYSQKRSWARATHLDDLPFSHHEGTLFISMKQAVPWDSGDSAR